MGIQEKIKELEDELHRTQKNKATEFHIGIVKSKIAQLRRELISPRKGGASAGGFDVKKTGNATVALIGLPSVGKSTILTKLTGAKSEVAAYQFTTLTCIPGILEYNGAKIQVLDLPGIIEGAKDGRGRGREVIAVARNADLILIILEAAYPAQHEVILKELYGFGIRVNEKPPNINMQKRARGGLTVQSTVPLTKISERQVTGILSEYSTYNGDVVIRDDITVDQFIDFVEGNRAYTPTLVIVNKIDTVPNLTKKKYPEGSIFISAENQIGIEELRKTIYNKLDFIHVYTKRKGEKVDYEEPLMTKRGITVGGVCESLHRDLRKSFKYALVTGKSVKHANQRVGLDHVLADEDVIYIVKK